MECSESFKNKIWSDMVSANCEDGKEEETIDRCPIHKFQDGMSPIHKFSESFRKLVVTFEMILQCSNIIMFRLISSPAFLCSDFMWIVLKR